MKSGRSRILLLLLTVLVFGFLVNSCDQKTESGDVQLPKDEIQVVKTVLDYVRAKGALGADTVVVMDAPTKGRTFLEEVPSQYKVAWHQLYEDTDINRCIDGLSNAGINTISFEEMVSRAKQDMKVSPRYRRRYVHVSPPAVDGHRAVIFCYWASGDLGGESRIFMLARGTGGWRIKRDRLLSMS
jgi:hypothetical protein